MADEQTPPAPPTAGEIVDNVAKRSGLSKEELALAKSLVEDGQDHLFAHWDAGESKKIKSQMKQLVALHKSYPLENGLLSYTANARKLLLASKEGKNPLEGWVPKVPKGEALELGTEKYDALEAKGLESIGKTGFVLVAGGLGERLGYNGIKVELPTETCTSMCYLEYYITTILSIQAKHAAPGTFLPLAIMVSDDTHDKTLALLKKNKYFGMRINDVTLMKQEKVAAIMNNDGGIAQSESDPFSIESKPHGHGDVHSLMHSNGLPKKWLDMGLEYAVFFQDTNGLGFHTLAAFLGVSMELDLVMNSLAIPRKAKQAVGAVCDLTSSSGESMTINVEYNQLDPLLRATVSKAGDVNDKKTGWSPYPGNINQLLFRLAEYKVNLDKTSGVMGEFVNPKYADDAKTKFKKPTRLECMMQDYPQVLKGTEDSKKVGFTSVAAGLCFSPVKNATADGAKKQKEGTHPAVAFSGESDQYAAVAMCLRAAGCRVQKGQVKTFLGVSMESGPFLVVHPAVCCQPSHYKGVFVGGDKINILGGSTLIVKGKGKLVVESLKLDGALIVDTGDDPASTLTIKDVVVENEGWMEKPIEEGMPSAEWMKMRGYFMERKEACYITNVPKRGVGKFGVSGPGYRVDAGAGQTAKWMWVEEEPKEEKGVMGFGGGSKDEEGETVGCSPCNVM